nr:sodium:solute symporter family protein [Candidatus Gracilibacteria bacterium]
MGNGVNSVMVISVFLYLFLTLAVGLFFARKVKNSQDYILSGKNLPLYIVTATAFATWFGAETVVGTSGSVIENGFIGIIEDPFGVAMCLILIGLFFARKLYRLNLVTLGDFYKLKYGRKVEIVASIIIILSYFGWIAAQMLALGKIFNIVTGIETEYGILIASIIVIIYTVLGGMYSIARIDFMQMILIFIGLIAAGIEVVLNDAGGFMTVFNKIPVGTFNMMPSLEPREFLTWVAAWITLGLGSIPQQDVYQRVMSSKNEKVAMWGSINAGLMYLTVAMIPIFLGLVAKVVYPELIAGGDTETVLTSMILLHTHVLTQILFFGALLSAIMSTASGALLAPSTILSENIIRPYFKHLDDKKFLLLTRYSVLFMAIISIGFALTNGSVYELVANAYSLVLVSIFVPLAFGLYWRKASPLGAMLSILVGILVYVRMEYYSADFVIPSLISGLLASIAGMVFGSYLPKMIHERFEPKAME